MKTRHLPLITLLCMVLFAGLALIPQTASAADTAKAGTYRVTFDQTFPDVSLASSVSVRVVGSDGKAIGQDHVYTRAAGESFKPFEFTESFSSRPYRLFFTLDYSEPGAAEGTTYTFHPYFRAGTQEIQTYYDSVITLGTCSIELLDAAAYGVAYDTDVEMDGQPVGEISVSAGEEPLTAESTVEPETEVEVSFSSSHYSLKTVKVTGESGADIPCGEVAGSPDHFIFSMPYEPVRVSVDPSAIEPMKIPYIDADGKTRYCVDYADVTEISESKMVDGTWYVARPAEGDANTFDYRLQVNGDVNLILCDGVKMDANKGISVPKGSSLTIWAQSQDENTMGQLKAVAPEKEGNENNEEAGIGGDGSSQGSGAITINGGHIDATGSLDGAAIGSGGGDQSCGPITINGGVITATTAPATWIIKGAGAAIGSGSKNESGAASINITDGTIDAKGAYGAGIGSGQDSVRAGVTISGGRITARGLSEFGAIIADTLNITGGSVKAIGKLGYDATGAAVTCSEGKLNCNGMFVYAGSGEWDSYSHQIEADQREKAIQSNQYVMFYQCRDHEMKIQSRESEHYEFCKWCGTVGEYKDHEYAYQYSLQDHWKQCTVCGHETAHEEHEFQVDTGKCVCGLSSAAKYIVHFDSDGGSAVPDQFVDEGSGVKEPETPVREGFVFLSWRVMEDGSLANEDYDFNTTVTSDLTLKAVWAHSVHNYTTLEKHDGHPATCESPGLKDFWECKVCRRLFADEFGQQELSNPETIEPLGHDYQLSKWDWNPDGAGGYESAEATFNCKRDSCNKTETVTDDNIYKSEKPATCVNGRIIYTATVEPDFLPYPCSSTKVVNIPAEEPRQHQWGEATYTWDEDHSGILAKRVCTLSAEHIDTERADTSGAENRGTVTSEVKKAPSCTEAGLTVYTATFKNPAFETQIAEVAQPAFGHTWKEIKRTQATTASAGQIILQCSKCQATKAKTIPKLKKNNPLKVKTKTVKLKAGKGKKLKKTKRIAPKKALIVSGAKGKVTYTKVKVNKKKFAKKFTINKKTGKITVKKGVKKGLYKMTIKVRAAGNNDYKPGAKTVTVKIRIR